MRNYGLSEESWMALKAEWETGVLTDRALAEKYGIDQKAIKYRAEREGWKRISGSTAEVVRLEIQNRVKSEVSDPKHIRKKHKPVEEMVPVEKRALLREVAMEHAIRTMAEATTSQLARAAELKVLFTDYANKIRDVLAGDDEAARAAAERILSSPTANIATAIAALTNMAEKIQKMERLALGIDQSPGAENIGRRDQNPLVLTNDGDTGLPVIDVTSLPDAQLVALRELATMTDKKRTTELPLPPRAP